MHRAACLALVQAALTCIIAACASTTLSPDVQVLGEHRFTRDDVRQIQELMTVSGVRRPISHITAQSRDRAIVYSEATSAARHERVVFTVFRRGDRWFVDRSSIRKEQTIDL